MNTLKITLKNASNAAAAKACLCLNRVKASLKDQSGQFVMDHAVVFVLIIVLAAAALLLLKDWLQNSLAPTLQGKVMEFFN